MIELGKNGTTFYVQGRDNIEFLGFKWNNINSNYNPKRIKIETHDTVLYKSFHCRVMEINNDSYGLQLITNNPEDFIPIVI